MTLAAFRADYLVAPLPAMAPVIPRKRISLLQYSPALVFLIIAIVDSQRYADPDLWGHVRFGQDTLKQGHLILTDPYSYSAPGHPWLNHEWLTEILMAWLYNHLGIVGLKLMKLACSAAIVLCLVRGMAETYARPVIQFVVLTIAAVTLALQVQFRPQLFTFAMLSALLAILAQYHYRARAPLWLAVPMLALWANLHGGFIIGIATLGIFTIVVLAEDVHAGRNKAGVRKLLAVSLLSTLATLATPYGIGTWQAVLHALTNPLTRTIIIDWQPLTSALFARVSDYHATYFYILLGVGLFAALGLTFAMTPRGDLPLVAVATVMIVAAFASIRNLPLAVIATVIPLCRHLDLVLEARRQRSGLPDPLSAPKWDSINQIVVATLACTLMLSNGIVSNKLIASGNYPVGAIAFMKEHHLSGNIVADFGWGEYVIWHLSPASKVYIDGRYDTVYPVDVIDKYISFYYGLSGGREFLVNSENNFVLLKPEAKALRFVNLQAGWKQIYRDSSCILFGRLSPDLEKLSSVTIDSFNTPKNVFP